MSPRHWQERVKDILDAIQEIEVFTQGMDFERFRYDVKTIKAVQLNLIVIGEAASHIPEKVQADHGDVPWHLIRGMRNRLVHVYFSVDPQIIWETIQNDIQTLTDSLLRLLKDEEGPSLQ